MKKNLIKFSKIHTKIYKQTLKKYNCNIKQNNHFKHEIANVGINDNSKNEKNMNEEMDHQNRKDLKIKKLEETLEKEKDKENLKDNEKNKDNYNFNWQTRMMFISLIFTVISLLFTMLTYKNDKAEEIFEKKLIESVYKIDIFKMKSIFRELVLEFNGTIIDLKEKQDHPNHPNKKMKKIDFLLTSKTYRKEKAFERYLHSIIYMQLLTLQFALSRLKHEKVEKYDYRFFKAKKGIQYFGLYLKLCDEQIKNKEITHDPTHDIFKLIDTDIYIWAIDVFYKNDKNNKKIKVMYEKLKKFQKEKHQKNSNE